MKTVMSTTKKLTMCGVSGLDIPTKYSRPVESDIDRETEPEIVGDLQSVFVLATVVSDLDHRVRRRRITEWNITVKMYKTSQNRTSLLTLFLRPLPPYGYQILNPRQSTMS